MQHCIDDRIYKINSFHYETYTSLVKTEIEKCYDQYVYKQEFLENKKIKTLTKEDFLDLAHTLSYLESINFIHGDLNKKNIIFTADGFKIIDYEPSLIQNKYQKKQYMITRPYVSWLDLEVGNITIRTDKLAFYYFILRINKVMTSKDVVALCSTLDHYQYLGMYEDEFAKMSYEDILNKAYQKLYRF